MNIQDLREKSKLLIDSWRERFPAGERASRYYTAIIILLVGLSSFGLGRLSVLDEQREPITIEDSGITQESPAAPEAGAAGQNQSASVVSAVNNQKSPPQAENVKGVAPTPGGRLVASKNGTKYYFPWCASNIAEKNKVWFNSEAEARARGLQPAGNCKGLK